MLQSHVYTREIVPDRRRIQHVVVIVSFNVHMCEWGGKKGMVGAREGTELVETCGS